MMGQNKGSFTQPLQMFHRDNVEAYAAPDYLTSRQRIRLSTLDYNFSLRGRIVDIKLNQKQRFHTYIDGVENQLSHKEKTGLSIAQSHLHLSGFLSGFLQGHQYLHER